MRMRFITPFKNISEGLRLVLLIAFIILGAAVSMGLAFGFYALVYGPSMLTQPDLMADINFVRIMQIFNQIGMFIVPAVFVAILTETSPAQYLSLNPTKPQYFLIALLLSISIGPLIGSLMELNEAMRLPDSLKSVEDWMKSMENTSNELTERMLSYADPVSITVNILMIVLLPAIGEELLFRAVLIPSFERIFRNAHLAVWIGAILFSAMHMQFYGFLPRFVLGLLFGYLFIYSRSVWVPVFAHFLNNGTIVLVTYLNRNGYLSESPEDLGHVDSLWLLVASIIITGALLWLLAKRPKAEI